MSPWTSALLPLLAAAFVAVLPALAWLARGYARAGDGARARSELAALDPALATRVESEIAARSR